KTMAVYAGWDFTNVWGRRNDRNDGYPYLRWTAPGLTNDADPIKDGVSTVVIDEDEHVDIYTPDGRLIRSGMLRNVKLGRGVYILRSHQKTSKVIVK
ncbi:MAG: T9SS type A sorting domain-containing protein, partial [Alloprevotella sp.]